MLRKQEESIYQTFIETILREKEYIILLCLKDIKSMTDDLDQLYEMGIISLYYAYKLYAQEAGNKNFDFLAYRFILSVMLDELKKQGNR